MNRVLVAALVCTLGVAMNARAAQEAPKAPASTAASAAALNLNSASVAQLEALPGIGRAMAERIVEYRQKNGSFKKTEDLMNVRGIGEKNFLKMQPYVAVGESAKSEAAAAKKPAPPRSEAN